MSSPGLSMFSRRSWVFSDSACSCKLSRAGGWLDLRSLWGESGRLLPHSLPFWSHCHQHHTKRSATAFSAAWEAWSEDHFSNETYCPCNQQHLDLCRLGKEGEVKVYSRV